MMEHEAGFIGPLNMGNPNEFRIRELAELVIELTGAKSRIRFEPLPQDDPTRRQPDIALAKQYMHWQPVTALREGLLRTIAWFRSIDMDQYRPPTPNY